MKDSAFRTAGISRGAARETCIRVPQARSRDEPLPRRAGWQAQTGGEPPRSRRSEAPRSRVRALSPRAPRGPGEGQSRDGRGRSGGGGLPRVGAARRKAACPGREGTGDWRDAAARASGRTGCEPLASRRSSLQDARGPAIHQVWTAIHAVRRGVFTPPLTRAGARARKRVRTPRWAGQVRPARPRPCLATTPRITSEVPPPIVSHRL